ncbi:MAG TPA: DNA methyltransferase [Nocardioidaceae bacterium]|nr:DNA methyltransferase [Nocardioidaceae bacterium]
MSARFIVADVFEGLAALKAEGTQVDLVLTSPPFLALRSYLPQDHPDKGKEIGSEPTPADFLDTMLAVVEACAGVLAPHGSICFEFGDTYAGSGGAGGDYADGGMREAQPKFRQGTPRWDRDNGTVRTTTSDPVSYPARARDGWPLDKSLCMIPELFAASLAYGRNLLDPERTTDPWRVRNTVAWVRPNPPVGALGDKVRPAKSLLTWACRARNRWFDLDAVRTEPNDHSKKYPRDAAHYSNDGYAVDERGDGGRIGSNAGNPAGAPPLDWWKISPGGFAGSHYAVYPPELCRIPIEASCPRRVCRTCGTPSRRVVVAERKDRHGNAVTGDWNSHNYTPGEGYTGMAGALSTNSGEADRTERTTTGWTTCGCPGTDGIRLDGYHTGTGWRPGIVLDPFGGSGTTGLVATGLSRDAVLIDLDARNADLALERVGMFLTVEHLAAEGAA